MSNFTDLVPPLELCRKIPAGEFADSAFYWFEELQQMNEKPPHDYRYFVNFADFHGYGWGGGRCCPAPTLQEIMVELPELTEAFKNDFDGKRTLWMVGESNYETTPVVAALKFWFMLKGIENE